MEIQLIAPPHDRKIPSASWRTPADIGMISADDHNMEVEHLLEAPLPALQKLKALGLNAMQMPFFPRGLRYNSRSMDPLWQTIGESGIPLSFHVTGTLEFSGYGAMGANIASKFSPFRPLLGQLLFSGVFERHPDLKVVFTEGGAGWVTDALCGMDKVCREYYSALDVKPPHLPSVYWKRQWYATFMDDPVAMRLIDMIGEDAGMWSLDFPHAEGAYGYAGEVAKGIYDALGHERAKKVL